MVTWLVLLHVQPAELGVQRLEFLLRGLRGGVGV